MASKQADGRWRARWKDANGKEHAKLCATKREADATEALHTQPRVYDVKTAREELGINQTSLAVEAGVSLTTLQSMEAGRPVSPQTLKRMTDALRRISQAGGDAADVLAMIANARAQLDMIEAAFLKTFGGQ